MKSNRKQLILYILVRLGAGIWDRPGFKASSTAGQEAASESIWLHQLHLSFQMSECPWMQHQQFAGLKRPVLVSGVCISDARPQESQPEQQCCPWFTAVWIKFDLFEQIKGLWASAAGFQAGHMLKNPYKQTPLSLTLKSRFPLPVSDGSLSHLSNQPSAGSSRDPEEALCFFIMGAIGEFTWAMWPQRDVNRKLVTADRHVTLSRLLVGGRLD